MEKTKRLFVDMDGTLCEWKNNASPADLYQEKFFLDMKPNQELVKAIEMLAEESPEQIYICSAVLFDSPYALAEKIAWLRSYLPAINKDHYIFTKCGEDKKQFIPGGISDRDILLDDHTPNLIMWNTDGVAVKAMNGINGKHGRWADVKGRTINIHQNPEDILIELKSWLS